MVCIDEASKTSIPKLPMALFSTYLARVMTILRGLLVAALFCTSGCTTKRTTSGEPIYFIRTAAYKEKLGTLKLTEPQAKERVVQYLRAKGATNSIFIGYHAVIVGDSFVFSAPRQEDVSLAGYYVDGHTGKVTVRNEGSVKAP